MPASEPDALPICISPPTVMFALAVSAIADWQPAYADIFSMPATSSLDEPDIATVPVEAEAEAIDRSAATDTTPSPSMRRRPSYLDLLPT